ncbi:MAG: patatin-like phospholipase family protein [Chitinophagaceae bacterium]
MRLFSLVLILFSSGVVAQQKRIENIVFEGAGIRGIAYAGAVKTLEEKDLLRNVKRVGGTSAGAVTALLLTLNYSSSEIATVINSTSFKSFNDGKFLIVGGFNRLRKWYGWYRGKRFENWLAELIAVKTGNAGITFSELHHKGYKDLYVTGTCLNKQQLVVFSFETYPHMKVKDAVRISMSIPLYFESVFVDSAGTIVTHPKNRTGLDVMLDGGFVANFPIKIFDSSRYTTAAEPNHFEINAGTIGLRIDSDNQINNDAGNRGLTSMPVNNLNQYLAAFYTLVLENLNRQTLTSEDWSRTISISDGGIGPRIRKLNLLEVEKLTENGSAGTAGFLQKL